MSTQRRIKPIEDEDIRWIARQMNLVGLDGARKEFLQCLDSTDISACPGSGKTTLVVAKLAILAKHWTSRTSGICVLSHTNVAREEIQRRLGWTEVGESAFRYPHYIDTIHGFVNRYLALPWLSSKGHRVTAIDDDLTERMRRRALGSDWWSVKPFLDPRHIELGDLRLTTTDFSNPLANWGVELSHSSTVYRKLNAALGQAAEGGYFRFDEMFLFAEELLRGDGDVAAIIRQRFPFVLIDEMQDTTPAQQEILERLFPSSHPDVTVQRVGDINQAIFEAQASLAGSFPDDERRGIDICDSFRFDDSIASLFSNFAVKPVEPSGLRGVGKSNPALPESRHTILIFPKDDASGVLAAFARIALRVLRPQHLENMKVAAVGAVHKPKPDVQPGDPKYPNTISHYWDSYVPNASHKAYQPNALIDCLRAARAMVTAMDNPVLGSAFGPADGTASSAVDSVALAMMRLVNLCSTPPIFQRPYRPHRSLELQLDGKVRAREIYRAIIARFVLSDEELTSKMWTNLVPSLKAFVTEFSPLADLADGAAFLAWTPPPIRMPVDIQAPPNSLVIKEEFDVVQIDISSIHAVKGETHAATLVLETFQNAHFFKSLMPWLIGQRADVKGCSALQLQRLKAAYVAMSRPAHLLCLAMPQSSLGEGRKYTDNVEKLRARGWLIEEILSS